MKNPLHYQVTDYDCGPTSMLNGISFLFEREEIPPEIMRNTVLYCLDCHGRDGVPGKRGTSCSAMMFLSSWLNSFGELGLLPVSSMHITGKKVCIGGDSLINDTLVRGGAVVARLFYDEWHYVLITGVRGDDVLIFDPYYREEPFENSSIKIVNDKPFEYNRTVPASCFNNEEEALYAFGEFASREAVLLFNKNTEITQEDTVEYFI